MPQNKANLVALSFDVEEFDVPMEHGIEIDFERQIAISTIGLERVLTILEQQKVIATFFCTATYAKAKPEIIAHIAKSGHEIASHSYYHSKFSIEDLLESKKVLENISGSVVRGYRSPRMSEISMEDLKKAGYEWDSSLNPCFLPGRYNNFSSPKMPFIDACGVKELPASVSPTMRLPLFWLALHNFPLSIYLWLCGRSLKQTGFLNIYMHPWEFSDNLHDADLKIPFIMKHNSGLVLTKRLTRLINNFKKRGATFATLSQLCDKFIP